MNCREVQYRAGFHQAGTMDEPVGRERKAMQHVQAAIRVL